MFRNNLVFGLVFAFVALFGACSAVPRPEPESVNTGMHVFIENSEGMLEEASVLPHNFLQQGVWVSGIEGDLRLNSDSLERLSLRLYATGNFRRVQRLGEVFYATHYAHVAPPDFEPSAVSLSPHAPQADGTRPHIELRVAPALP